MALLYTFDEENEILEGFLCPICKSDLKSPERLTAHVEQLHSEEQDLLKSLREILNIAKKKILNLDEATNDLARSFDNTRRNNFATQDRNVPNPSLNDICVVGTDCDHISYFKAIRNPRLERYASETNKLIIRLNKLLTDRPSDASQRKQHEQQIVPWLDGKLVNLCPSCAKSFGLTRRQHHCRLCGSIMCDNCSLYLPVPDAVSIVCPSLLSPSMMQNVDTKDGESNSFRICEHCLHLLENRKEMQDSRIARPLVTKLYEKIDEIKKDIEPDIPMYCKIVNSLYGGDSIFRLADASALREKIGRSAESIDNISKHILAIKFSSGSREEALQKAIRLSCIAYIKERMLSIPTLPLEDEIKKMQLQRSQEAAKRIERERRLALEAFEKYELQTDNQYGSSSSSTTSAVDNNSKVVSAISTMDNWSGYQINNSSGNADPLIEQMNIIKGYIKQARQAMRFDEVATLEMNLNELKQEFYNRQLQNKNSI